MGSAATQPTVLLVEDEALISRLVAGWLSESGFAVHAAATGDEALQYIGGGGEVDVLFTDVNLPGGIDGAELARRVRKMRPDLPVIYASGRYGSREFGPVVPHSAFVAKPYDQADVRALLERLTAA
jgi:CheY-like chemotaxis protein